MKRYQALILDLDNTVVMSETPLRGFYAQYATANAEWKSRLRSSFARQWAQKCLLPQGMREMLDEVRRHGVPLAVVTASATWKYKALLETFGIAPDVVVGAFDIDRYGQRCKPKPDQMLVALARLDVEASEVLSVGNELCDIVASHAAGIDVALAGWSLQQEDAEWHKLCSSADHVLSHPAEVLPLLDKGCSLRELVWDVPQSFVPQSELMVQVVSDMEDYSQGGSLHFSYRTVVMLAVARWLILGGEKDLLTHEVVRLCNRYPRLNWPYDLRVWLMNAHRCEAYEVQEITGTIEQVRRWHNEAEGDFQRHFNALPNELKAILGRWEIKKAGR